MSLADILRTAVDVANKVTGPLQSNVRHRAWLSQGADGQGLPSFGGVVVRPALVEFKHDLVRVEGGESVMSRATVTFLDSTVVISPLDEIVLPDGTTGPILSINGFTDPATTRGFVTEVTIG